MPHLVYSDEREPFTGRPTPYHLQDACRAWLKHYANWKYLEFMRVNGDQHERRQALHEQQICQRKMDHWTKHANWSAEGVSAKRAELDRTWSIPR